MRRNLQIFIYGMIGYGFAEVFLRYPLIKLLEKVNFENIISNEILYGLILSIFAGLFLTLIQFFLRKYIYKTDEGLYEPIYMGLGMGLMKFLFIFLPLISLKLPLSFVMIALSERLIYIFITIILSILVYISFSEKSFSKYFFLIFLVTSLYDFILVLMATYNLNPYIIYLFYIIAGIIGFKWAFNRRKESFVKDNPIENILMGSYINK